MVGGLELEVAVLWLVGCCCCWWTMGKASTETLVRRGTRVGYERGWVLGGWTRRGRGLLCRLGGRGFEGGCAGWVICGLLMLKDPLGEIPLKVGTLFRGSVSEYDLITRY